jgi:hypothetical protein
MHSGLCGLYWNQRWCSCGNCSTSARFPVHLAWESTQCWRVCVSTAASWLPLSWVVCSLGWFCVLVLLY